MGSARGVMVVSWVIGVTREDVGDKSGNGGRVEYGRKEWKGGRGLEKA